MPKDPCTFSFKSLFQGVLPKHWFLIFNFGTFGNSGDFGNHSNSRKFCPLTVVQRHASKEWAIVTRELYMNWRRALFLAVLFFYPVIASAASSLSTADIEAIKQLHKQYETTWLKGDADGIRFLFTDDCVLFPPHADTPKLGKNGMNAFWFPPGAPPSTITKLIVTPQDIGGDGQIAYAWGTDEVSWTTVEHGKTTTSAHSGRFLNVLKKQPDGSWKISHHMWDDPVASH